MIRGKIRALDVRGFRRFQTDTKFTFDVPGKDEPPNTLVIAGANGSGKSTFLEAILYALGRESLMHRQLRKDDRDRWFKNAFAAGCEIRLELQVYEATGTKLGLFGGCRVEVIRRPGKWVLQGLNGAAITIDDETELRPLLEQIPVEWFSSWRQPYLCGAVPPSWKLPIENAHGEARRLWKVKQRIIDARVRSAALRSTEPGNDVAWLEKLNKAWSALHGTDGTRIDIGAGKEDTSYDLVVERYFEEPEAGWQRICGIDQLSSGELEWLTLAGTLITTDFEANETEGTPGIVLIDEPELHLHYEWQAPLLAALRTVVPKSQLLLATHADPPWDQVYTFERVLLPPEDPRAEVST